MSGRDFTIKDRNLIILDRNSTISVAISQFEVAISLLFSRLFYNSPKSRTWTNTKIRTRRINIGWSHQGEFHFRWLQNSVIEIGKSIWISMIFHHLNWNLSKTITTPTVAPEDCHTIVDGACVVRKDETPRSSSKTVVAATGLAAFLAAINL